MEELEDECERIEKIIQGKYNQINEPICDIEEEAQRMIEYDWKEYNINIFKQWKIQMMEQYIQTTRTISNVVNGVSRYELSYESKLGKLGGNGYLAIIELLLFGKLFGDTIFDEGNTNVNIDIRVKHTITDLKSDGKFLCDIGNDCGSDCHDYLVKKFWFFIIDDGG